MFCLFFHLQPRRILGGGGKRFVVPSFFPASPRTVKLGKAGRFQEECYLVWRTVVVMTSE